MRLSMRIISLASAFILLISTGGLNPPVDAAPLSAPGITVTVNLDSDAGDGIPGDGFCDTLPGIMGDQCTLRAAIEEINALGSASSPHLIHFNIPGTGPFTITPNPEYPVITVPVQIDGITQPGAACPTATSPAHLMIILNGSNAGVSAEGVFLQLGSSGSRIRGLVIGNFSSSGISIFSHDNQVICNHVGIGQDGESSMGNDLRGIYVAGNNNTIGGQASHAQRNVISENGNSLTAVGLTIHGMDNVVRNNYIGTTAAGDDAASNILGVLLSGNENYIGGSAPLAGNVISGNGIGGGLGITGQNNIIQGNLIGVAADGITPLRNTGAGIYLDVQASGNQVGGTASGEENRIGFNFNDGISVLSDQSGLSVHNTLRGNWIYGNFGLGIDLGNDGVTANDIGDLDFGANNLQNYPVLEATPGSAVISGTLNSWNNTTYDIDVYSNQNCDESGRGEGQQYLATVQATTNGLGEAAFTVDLTGKVNMGNAITATATDLSGNTSEFSNCVYIGPATGMTFIVNQFFDLSDEVPGDYHCDTSEFLDGDQCSLRAAIMEINSLGPGTTRHRIEFDLGIWSRIDLTSPLPEVNVPVFIDGSTQQDAACPTAASQADLKVILDGSNAGTPASGLVLGVGSDSSILRGLVIVNFAGAGIRLASDNNTVACNHIGLAEDGATAMGNEVGVLVSGSGNMIGGQDFPGQRNVISGNSSTGIALLERANGNFLVHNYIGTTADGISAAGNGQGGVNIAGDNTFVVHGSETIPGNLISGNGGYGVRIDRGDDNVFTRNFIGLARDGITPLPNQGNGIEILGSALDNEVGGPVDLLRVESGAIFSGGNLIANNDGHGIALYSAGGGTPMYNLLRLNTLYDNEGLGIELGDNGVDDNDPADADGGPNQGQNYPVLRWNAGSDVVTVHLASKPNSSYSIEIYRSPSCDPALHGEGQKYLETIQMTTDPAGIASSTVDLAGLVYSGDHLTATASDSDGNTSEFSACAVQFAEIFDNVTYLPIISR